MDYLREERAINPPRGPSAGWWVFFYLTFFLSRGKSLARLLLQFLGKTAGGWAWAWLAPTKPPGDTISLSTSTNKAAHGTHFLGKSDKE
jgi:hypothetical protein